MTALPTLITEYQTKATAMKATADDLITWLSNHRNDMHQVEADLAAKRRLYDTEIARLNRAIEDKRKELADVERTLAQARRDTERERKNTEVERKRLREIVDQTLAA
jgi:hypothetical protein